MKRPARGARHGRNVLLGALAAMLSSCGPPPVCGSELLDDLATARRGKDDSEQDVTKVARLHIAEGADPLTVKELLEQAGFSIVPIRPEHQPNADMDREYLATAGQQACKAFRSIDEIKIVLSERGGRVAKVSAVIHARKVS